MHIAIIKTASQFRPTSNKIYTIYSLLKQDEAMGSACRPKQMSNLIDLAIHACRVLMLLLEDSHECPILIQSCSHFAGGDASRLQIAGLTAARSGRLGQFHQAPWL
jgi:hypothetical protein